MNIAEYDSMSFKVLLVIILSKYGETFDEAPDLCTHSARYDTATQYYIMNGTRKQVMFFVTSGGYYWLLKSKEYPSIDTSKGKLPNGFKRGDAAYFRVWPTCQDYTSIPQIIVYEYFENATDFWNSHIFISYFIDNNTWSSPKLISEDPVLHHFNIETNRNIKIDTIINFSNIKVGPFANQFGNEFLYVFVTQIINSNIDYYYNRISHQGCGSDGFTESTDYIPVKQTLWKMDKPIDAAFVYTEYHNAVPGKKPIFADIALFQDIAHYQFETPLDSIVNKGIFSFKHLLVQYYSTWLDCAEGLYPEIPPNPVEEPVSDHTNSTDPEIISENPADSGVENKTNHLHIPNHTHEDIGHKVEETKKFILISVLLVLSTASVLLTISVIMIWTIGNADNQKSNQIKKTNTDNNQKLNDEKVPESKSFERN